MIPTAALVSLLILQSQDPAEDDREWKDKDRADAHVVAAAMISPDRAWPFITSPESPYAERRAVAARAGEVLDLSFLMRIDALRTELLRHPEATLRPGDPGEIKPGEPIIISGSRKVPPTTFEIRSKGHWRWQVRESLQDAWYSILRSARPDAFSTWGLNLPCESVAEAEFFTKVISEHARFHGPVGVETIGAWRNVLLRTDRGLGNALGALIHSSWAIRPDDPDPWRLAHVIVLDRVSAGDVYGASGHAYLLREAVSTAGGSKRAGSTPYSAVLAITREAISNESLDPYVRVMSGLGVARALGETLPIDGLHSTVDEDQPEIIRRFTEWFATREEAVVRGAAAETAALDRARKTLAQVRQCATGEPLPSH